MYLTYRGLTYELNLTGLKKLQHGVNAKYRGIDYQISSSSELVPQPVTEFQLKYRGVSYSKYR